MFVISLFVSWRWLRLGSKVLLKNTVPFLNQTHHRKTSNDQRQNWDEKLFLQINRTDLKKKIPHTRTHTYTYFHHHHHHAVPLARIFRTLSRHFSPSLIASGRSSRLHPVSSHSCCVNVRAGRSAFARPYVGVHRSTSLMSSSLLLQQCPACLVRLAWIVFVMGGRWPYSWCRVLPPGLVQYCSQHSCVIDV